VAPRSRWRGARYADAYFRGFCPWNARCSSCLPRRSLNVFDERKIMGNRFMRGGFGGSKVVAAAVAACGVAAVVAGCSFRLGSDSSGDKGNFRFEYVSDDCLFGCSLDQATLQGSLVTVGAQSRDPNTRFTARLADGKVGSIASQREECSCDSSSSSSSSSSSVAPGGTCPSGATKSCTIDVDVQTTNAGDTKIEMVDPQGNVNDTITLHVRPAARIDLAVLVDANPITAGRDGAYSVHRGTNFGVQSTVYDASGSKLVYTQHGVSHYYADLTVLSPDTHEVFGATDIEAVVTGRAGDTEIVCNAPGAQTTARFHVLP
jgi:hypothetical protein